MLHLHTHNLLGRNYSVLCSSHHQTLESVLLGWAGQDKQAILLDHPPDYVFPSRETLSRLYGDSDFDNVPNVIQQITFHRPIGSFSFMCGRDATARVGRPTEMIKENNRGRAPIEIRIFIVHPYKSICHCHICSCILLLIGDNTKYATRCCYSVRGRRCRQPRTYELGCALYNNVTARQPTGEIEKFPSVSFITQTPSSSELIFRAPLISHSLILSHHQVCPSLCLPLCMSGLRPRPCRRFCPKERINSRRSFFCVCF